MSDTSPSAPPPGRSRRRRAWVWAVAATVVTVLVVLVGLSYLYRTRPLSRTMDSALIGLLATGDASALSEGGGLSEPVQIVNIGSDYDFSGRETPDQAVSTLQSTLASPPSTHWDLISTASVSAYRAGPYAACFPQGAVVARSSDGRVISFIGFDTTITKLCIAESDQLLR